MRPGASHCGTAIHVAVRRRAATAFSRRQALAPFLAFVLVASCARDPARYDDAFVAMHAPVELTFLCRDEAAARAAQTAVRAEVERLEALLSDYRPTSQVSRLNERQAVTLAPETHFLLRRAQEVCRETGGAFDISMGPIKRLWGFGDGGIPHVPDSLALHRLLQHVGCNVYEIDPNGGFRWHDAEARLDLGGIAQGFVANCVAETLRARGITRFLVNMSGDIIVGGVRPGGGPWRIGVQNPRQPDSLLARLPMRFGAVTTSGDYEQFFIVDGQRYHHVFDPQTGTPARGAASVSVFSDDPVDADCYATALLVMGPERGLAFVASRSDLGAIFVRDTGAGKAVMQWSAALAADLGNRARGISRSAD